MGGPEQKYLLPLVSIDGAVVVSTSFGQFSSPAGVAVEWM